VTGRSGPAQVDIGVDGFVGWGVCVFSALAGLLLRHRHDLHTWTGSQSMERREDNRQGLLVTPLGVTVGYGEPHRRCYAPKFTCGPIPSGCTTDGPLLPLGTTS
jgi:hypothetical protein